MRSIIAILFVFIILLLVEDTLPGRSEAVQKAKLTSRRRYIVPNNAKNLRNWVKSRMQFILKPRKLRNFWEGWRFIYRPKNRFWWNGPNVCDNRVDITGITAEKALGAGYSANCKDMDTAYRCLTRRTTENGTNQVISVRECCKGFIRNKGDYGCSTELDLKNITETANEHGLTNLLGAFESTNILPQLNQEGITIFAPSNAAFENISQIDLFDNLIGQQKFKQVVAVNKSLTDQLLNGFQNILLGHMVNHETTTNRMYNEQLVVTSNSLGSTIRINTYESNKIITVNCKDLKSRDIMATNGIIHVIDGLLEPVSESLLSVISKHPRLRNFKSVLDGSGMNTTFTEGHYTIFAPTDDSFNKTDRLEMDSLFNHSRFLKEILQNHVIPSVICPSAIQKDTIQQNLLKKNLTLKDVNGTVYVNGMEIVESYTMATNGILYLIDDVMLPKQEFTVLDVAERENATKFLDFIKGTELETTLEEAENIQFFVPSNDAFAKLESSNISLLQDNEALENVIRYHVSPSRKDEWYNNYQMDTWINERKIRINNYVKNKFKSGYKHRWTAQCSTITKGNLKSDNGVVHIIDKVLMPPKGTVMDVLIADGRFTEFVRYLEKWRISSYLKEEGPYTVFAPTDRVFDELNKEEWEFVESNFDFTIRALMTDHIVEDVLCCAGISDRGKKDQKINILSRYTTFRILEQNSTFTVKGKEIKECDIMATNGVIHAMDDFVSYLHA